jgi:hypothetical protein
MKNSVKTYRAAGLEAKWGRTRRGAPAIFVRNPSSPNRHQRETWWMVDRSMYELMSKLGVLEGFDSATLLGDLFSVPA